MIRKAQKKDLDQIEAIYERIHDAEENGEVTIGWIRNVYPIRKTAEGSLTRKDLSLWKRKKDCAREKKSD